MADKRLNIGLMIDDFDHYFSSQACKGAELAAKALDANLFIFPGHYIGKPDSRYSDKEYEYQYNTVFDLPTVNNVDILYVVLGTICSRADMEMQKRFLKSLPKVPVVCLFSNCEDLPSVTFDNATGLKEAIEHLIEDHGAREIGYVSGPITNQDARERLDVFTSVMNKYGLPIGKDKIVYGDFTENSITEVEKLLDQNGKLDAIVFANDYMAMSGYKALAKRDLKAGKDVLVTGFDDDVFSINLEPPLTTVEASSAELTYKAVMNARNYINGTALSDMFVETHLILRGSCGCRSNDTGIVSGKLLLDKLEGGDRAFIEEIKKYLFGIFTDDGPIPVIKEKLDVFLNRYADFVLSEEQDTAEAVSAFTQLIKTPLLTYTKPEKLFNVFLALQNEAEKIMKDSGRCQITDKMFSDFYRRLSFSEISATIEVYNRNNSLSRMVKQQTGDIFLLPNENDIPYDQLLGGLYSAGFKKSLLYLFQGNVKNKSERAWRCPNSILLKAVSDRNGVRELAEEQQLLRTELLFTNEFVENAERATMVVSPLFVGEDIYGFLVNDINIDNIMNVAPVEMQLSVTLKSLLMIEEQNKVKHRLQNSLERFIRDNTKLEEIARQDELTGLFNRRGFIADAEKMIGDPLNNDKVAILCFADMDNLKMVNDKFGHDDGDFALRTIAAVLRESFRDSDIIGRLGGDEFVVLAVTGTDCDVAGIKDRIERVTKRYNEKAGKPYPIAMSTGIYKFKCSAGINIYDILDNADRLLYEEKTRKKKQYGSYR
ncbi:MAG: GGDEF domain-containing protein [Clostridiales bacterium]|nr:GGDEF domain-containing protein [Clostridiales bacterium]